MVNTPSTMLKLGTPAPDFKLTDAVSGEQTSLQDFRTKVLVVMFICNHCPFVIHVRGGITQLAREFAEKDVAFVAINANDLEKYPQDGPEHMKELAEEMGWTFPFLFDDTQEVAKAYRAACTPDFFIFDAKRRLAYRGQLDDSRPSKDTPVTGKDVRAAIHALLADKPVNPKQTASIGCNIKWRPGNEPDYFR
ncbi:MAG: thioredoxin family protein [Candidatus Krumholzibacteria bacterium]|nr:thioredoxin family protein [Candidatus Krumholzibacteria bacterium]